MSRLTGTHRNEAWHCTAHAELASFIIGCRDHTHASNLQVHADAPPPVKTDAKDSKAQLPTAIGLPTSEGSSRIATAAKNISISTTIQIESSRCSCSI